MLMSIAKTYGALLIGTLFASIFSGIFHLQCLFYGRRYGNDPLGLKTLVLAVWILDVFHNAAVWSCLWTWFIADFGSPEKLDMIPIGVPLSIIATGILTLLVHCFFLHRIFQLVRNKLTITVPIFILAVFRLGSALATSHLMLKHNSLSDFKNHHRWVFSLGLALSSVVDVLITGVMMTVLRRTRSKSMSLETVISTLIVYTLENGAITTAATIISMICWLTMDNLIFLALHFIIAKLYANSILAMLNCRSSLRERKETEDGVIDLGMFRAPSSLSFIKSPPMQVSVSKSVEHCVDAVELPADVV
ncbi:hypothetical protein PM082_014054 [Marasmius tenuissimus]|nr:hypothetical protein PM082_014054 [Marasmius tenuissimus]